MKILAITSIRSEYDLMSYVYKKLDRDSGIDLRLLVGGCHNSPSFGLTVKDIKKDGFNILCQIDSLIDSDSSAARLKSASVLLLSCIDVVNAFSPDLIIYAGDREDVMIGALLGGYLGIPTVHFFGGDHASDGHIDNPIRHAVSKLSTCHFVSIEEHKKRLLKIGEPSSRIFNIGSVALDKFKEIPIRNDILDFVAGRKVSRPAALFIFHPVEDEIEIAPQLVYNIIHELIENGYHVFVGLPNSDHGYSGIREVLNNYSSDSNVSLYGNLPRDLFVQLFKACKLIMGNSSAGILEAASVPIPCINVGLRQRGRMSAENVIFIDSDLNQIKDAIMKIKDETFLSSISNISNPYGDGNASDKAVELIKSVDFSAIYKKYEDPLYVEQ
ncbi:UDP-N-acetylglucosamine 2-epimerase (hydrolyzing) [Vibrio cholerae]|uniref:UDP-N-acetylglucosamine 2-epimerase n=1 Tax=Vibrio cholerae TaxID=666 RepID=UPI001157694C|nr:UDP-N-acetylglucosamine 2-epimerase [Vibrio cholerae]EGR0627449.1 UDP-N-acetylglucosamine 2-epimerase (hydrolyzing) [Vibrio cholerae]EGR0778409.1 UDP-N-acetylglucosamine 2-epimerase (hydrolyzing) [Vibrio cholerae]EGR0782099.1 UDP-N-acetylglucosamine 2-epimerase (hydrolyzing) [Vibrio cholerae]EGR0794267.1 UDP-N-acetylglucosamine 2-epimerase (hydrolyzing) [Vibrio cholerae]EGR0808082.1 UDP-N-acetylglucosamine 2-epimerase (hydrolyzing) [Vibrio cholerae]